MSQFIHPDDLPPLHEHLTNLCNQVGMTFSTEFRGRHANGTWRMFEATLTNLLDHPAIRGIVVKSHDITERRRSEEAMRFQAQLLNTVGQAVIATNLHNQIIYWNRFAETLYGWSAQEAINRKIANLTPTGAAHEEAAAIMVDLRTGESWHGEFTMQRRDGTTVPALVTDTPILDEKGTLLGIIQADCRQLRGRR